MASASIHQWPRGEGIPLNLLAIDFLEGATGQGPDARNFLFVHFDCLRCVEGSKVSILLRMTCQDQFEIVEDERISGRHCFWKGNLVMKVGGGSHESTRDCKVKS